MTHAPDSGPQAGASQTCGNAGRAVIAVSRRGSGLALRIEQTVPDFTAFLPSRFLGADVLPEADDPRLQQTPSRIRSYDGRVAPLVETIFRQHRSLVLVMALGAAVRLIAPLLRHKSVDPAVVVVDDAGRYAISLLSGHLGGANELTLEIARALDAQAVITTAAEAAHVRTIDLLARAYGWRIEPGAPLTHVAAALVNGDPVGVYQDAGTSDWLTSRPVHLRVYDSMATLAAACPQAAIVISDRASPLADSLAGRTVVCRPQTLILGIGCSRGASAAEIGALVDQTLAAETLSPLAIAAVATIDRRRDEAGLRELVAERGWTLTTYNAAELDAVSGDWLRSEIVRKAVGTGGVAEPAALACAGVEQLLVRKQKSARVTLAIARRSVDSAVDSPDTLRHRSTQEAS